MNSLNIDYKEKGNAIFTLRRSLPELPSIYIKILNLFKNSFREVKKIVTIKISTSH